MSTEKAKRGIVNLNAKIKKIFLTTGTNPPQMQYPHNYLSGYHLNENLRWFDQKKMVCEILDALHCVTLFLCACLFLLRQLHGGLDEMQAHTGSS